MSQILDQLRIIIEQIITGIGYPGITVVMFTENVFPPIPSELVMPFAGFLAARGEFTFVGVVVAGVIGSVLGALVLYYIGVWADELLIRNFIRRYGRWFLLSENDLNRALSFFGKYGEAVVFFGRLIPIIRSIISIPAGMNRMPLPKFLFFTALGTTIWTGVLAYAGVFLGENWEAVLDIVDQYQDITLVVLVILVVIFVATRLMQRFRGQKTSATEEVAAK